MSLSTENHSKQATEVHSGYQEDLAFLLRIPLFSGVEYDFLKLLAMICRRLELTAGDQIMVEGEDDGHAYLILAGRVDALSQGEESSRLIRQYVRGDFIGGCSLLGKMPRNFTLTAAETTSVLRLSREQVQKTLQQHPEALPRITANLIAALTRWDQQLLDMPGSQEMREAAAMGVSLL